MSSTRFAPNDFAYNFRVGMALVPALATAASICSTVVPVLAIGSMVSYIMDAMSYREGSFTCR